MLQNRDFPSLEDASADLMQFVRAPENWLSPGRRPAASQGEYHRRVGGLRLRASVDVTADLAVRLRISFRAPGLTPMQAVEHLETFLHGRLPLLPNAEWQVEVDGRRWIHFSRRYLGPALRA